MIHEPSRIPSQPLQWATLALGLIVLLAGGPARGTVDGRYVCRSLPEVLEELRQQGMSLVYSSELVRPEMQIKTEPRGGLPEHVLDQILSPFGLKARPDGSGSLAVVRGPGWASTRAAEIRASLRRRDTVLGTQDSPGVLPAWVDAAGRGTEIVELRFPDDGEARWQVPPEARFLHVRLGSAVLGTGLETGPGASAAFRLKELLVDVRARSRDLRVALQGDAGTLDRLMEEGLGPYVDGYVFTDRPFVPDGDRTGRSWWRSTATDLDEPGVLGALLDADARGVELAIFEGLRLTPAHRRFLERIQATPSGYLDQQPQVVGIEQEAVRFFLDPDSGHYYLAVYATPGVEQDIRFSLDASLSARSLYPRDAAFEFESYGRRAGLMLDGSHRHYLFELEPAAPQENYREVLVEDRVIVDPYEVVVQNQVFQQREAKKFQSLDVMEFMYLTPQWPGGSQITWEHRLIFRRDRLTDYHHLGYLVNGVRVPEGKLYKGRIHRPAASVELQPLEVELDETYAYSYIGQEVLDGHPTWKIGFRPVVPGVFLSGEVWIDQRTGAHRRMHAVQSGLKGSQTSREVTYFYDWIPSGGECFWDWRRNAGLAVYNSLGFQYSYQTEVERRSFRFNRPDIEEEVARAYASDVMIHVETPPAGHRWLVREEDGKRRSGEAYPVSGFAKPQATQSLPDLPVQPPGEEDPASTPSGGLSGRVLADVHAFAAASRVQAGVTYTSEGGANTFYGLSFNHADLLKRGYQLSLGALGEDGLLALSNPNLFGSRLQLTVGADYSPSAETDYAFSSGSSISGDDNSFRNLSLETRRKSFNLALGLPVNRYLTTRLRYQINDLSFARRGSTAADFVVPSDTLEHIGRLDLRFHRRGFSSEAFYEVGQRDDWRPWGIEGQQEAQDRFARAQMQIGVYRRLGETQILSGRVAAARAWDTDRFSRFRLWAADFRVPGYSSGLAFDQAANLRLGYSTSLFRKVPLNFRLDASRVWTDQDNDIVQDLVGLQVTTRLHGPFRTDIFLSIGQGLMAEPKRSSDGTTTYLMLFSRRLFAD